MDLAGTLIANAAQFALVASRIAGFVVSSPFPGAGVGTKQRVGLVVVLAWVASSFAAMPQHVPDFGLMLVGWAAVEIACGAVIGVAFRFVFAAAEVLGGILGLASGLGTPSAFNPALDAQETVLGHIVSLLALLVALGIGAHRIALSALLDSFRTIPVGTGLAFDAPLMAFADLAIDAFAVGVRLSMPVVAVALIVHAALAMISRAAPSLQIFSVGLGIVIASTILTLIACLGDLTAGLAAHFGSLSSALDGVLGAVVRP